MEIFVRGTVWAAIDMSCFDLKSSVAVLHQQLQCMLFLRRVETFFSSCCCPLSIPQNSFSIVLLSVVYTTCGFIPSRTQIHTLSAGKTVH